MNERTIGLDKRDNKTAFKKHNVFDDAVGWQMHKKSVRSFLKPKNPTIYEKNSKITLPVYSPHLHKV